MLNTIALRRISLFFAVGLTSACMPIRKSGEGSEVKYISLGGTPLMDASLKDVVEVCMTTNEVTDTTELTKWKQQAEKAALAWIEALRPLSQRPLATSALIELQESCDASSSSADIFIFLRNQDGISSFGGKSMNFYTKDTRGYSVLLHEFGHAFGLGDTYTGERLNGRPVCEAGQPDAVMCQCTFEELQADDRIGARSHFLRKYPNAIKPTVLQVLEERGLMSTLQDIANANAALAAITAPIESLDDAKTQIEAEMVAAETQVPLEIRNERTRTVESLQAANDSWSMYHYENIEKPVETLRRLVESRVGVGQSVADIATALQVTEAAVQNPELVVAQVHQDKAAALRIEVRTKEMEMLAAGRAYLEYLEPLIAAKKVRLAEIETQKNEIQLRAEAPAELLSTLKRKYYDLTVQVLDSPI